MSTSLSSKRILITGATGFIGRYLVEEAQKAGLQVWIAIRPASDRRRAEALGGSLIELDYRDSNQMRSAIRALPFGAEERPWHYVIHNAGLTKSSRPEEFYEANAESTRRLCEVLEELGASRMPEHFVLTSSLGVYGAPDPQRGLIHSEQTSLRPTSVYGKSKLLAEQYLAGSTLPYSIIQPTGVYGPGDKDYLLALASLEKGINCMAGCSEQTLTFVYGADVARAAIHILGDSRAMAQKFIVSDGEAWQDYQFTQLAQELLGQDRVLNLRVPLPLLWLICKGGDLYARLTGKTTPLNGDKYSLMAQRSWLCDISPLRALGWEPRYQLREGLLETIAWGRKEGLLKAKEG